MKSSKIIHWGDCMPEMRIDVSVEKLRSFSTDVGTFKTKISVDCEDLVTAMKRLQASMDEYTVASMVDVVKRIEKILDNAEPVLSDLGKSIDQYADFVERLRTIANS